MHGAPPYGAPRLVYAWRTSLGCATKLRHLALKRPAGPFSLPHLAARTSLPLSNPSSPPPPSPPLCYTTNASLASTRRAVHALLASTCRTAEEEPRRRWRRSPGDTIPYSYHPNLAVLYSYALVSPLPLPLLLYWIFPWIFNMVGDDSPTCFTWSRMYCSIYQCGRSTVLIMFYDTICSHPWISIHILCCRFDKIFKLWYINCHAILYYYSIWPVHPVCIYDLGFIKTIRIKLHGLLMWCTLPLTIILALMSEAK
jgi:hypothetical protein